MAAFLGGGQESGGRGQRAVKWRAYSRQRGGAYYNRGMSDGKHCPGCGKDIGVWPVLVAGLPTWVQCPHCRARLSYGSYGVLVAAMFALLLLLSGVAFYFARKHYAANEVRFLVLLAVILVAVWLPVELLATMYLRRWGKLEKLL